MPDVIDGLAGIRPGTPLDAIRARRLQARAQAQATHDALFAPAEPGEVSLVERLAVAAFVIGLHDEPGVTEFYATALAEAGAPPALQAAVAKAAAAGRITGPFGHYPAGPLSREDTEGQGWQAGPALAEALGPRLAAAAGHAHRLVFQPRDADAAWLQALLDAGWSTTGIVTLSQIVAFLSFQVRTIHGLAILNAEAPR